MARQALRFVLRDDLQALSAAQTVMAGFLRGQGAGPRTTARAELLLEELALNVLRHGFTSGGRPEVAVTAWHDGLRCGLDLEDRGAAFDPTTAVLPGRPRTLRQAPTGGRGVALLRRTAAELAYERTTDGRNRLHVVLPAEDASIG